MLLDSLPSCRYCGGCNYSAHSSHHGVLSDSHFTCVRCETFVRVLSHGSDCQVLTFVRKGACEGPDTYGAYQFPPALTTWFDRTLLPTWRHRKREREDFDRAEWAAWISEVFLKKFPELTAYGPEGRMTFRELPEEAQRLVNDTWGTGMPVHGRYRPYPEHLKAPVYPPQAPRISGVLFMVDMGSGWECLDYQVSERCPVPEDPILKDNREFFDDVWTAVSRNIEQPVPERIETRNQYGGPQPWYRFKVRDATFTVGWRKRVVSITVDSPEGIDVEDIRSRAMIDGTTFTALGPPQEHLGAAGTVFQPGVTVQSVWVQDSIEPDQSIARTVLIHAWGKEKTIEYLTVLCRTVLLQGVV